MSVCEIEIARNIVANIECIYTILVQNRIYKRNKKFYCYLCRLEVKNLLDAVYHATSDKEHAQRNKMSEVSYEMMCDSMLDEEKSVQLVFNGVVIIRLPEFFCNICLCAVTSINSILKHINELQHVEFKVMPTLNSNSIPALPSSNYSTNSSIDKTESCTNCDNKSEEKSQNIHSLPSTSNYNLDDNVHNANYSESNKICETFEDKPITIYTCTVCKDGTILKNTSVEKYHRMYHISDKNYSSNNLDIIKFYFKSFQEKYMHCLVCDVKVIDEMQLESHLKYVNHKKNVKLLKRNCNLINDNNTIIANSLVNWNAERCPNQLSVSSTVIEMSLYCQLCNVAVPYSENTDNYKIHAEEKNHKQNLQRVPEQNNFIVKSNFERIPILKCFLCDIEFAEESSLWLHYKSDSHFNLITAINKILQDKNLIFFFEEKNNGIRCTVCQKNKYDLGSIISHISSPKHKKNSQISISNSNKINSSLNSWKMEVMSQDQVQIKKNQEKDNKILYSCPICDIYEKREFTIIEHLKSTDHHQKYLNSSSLQDFKFVCPICDITFSNDEQFIDHLESSNHLQVKLCVSAQSSDNDIKSNENNKNYTISSYNLIDDSKCCVSTSQAESLNTENMNALLDDLISFEPNEETDIADTFTDTFTDTFSHCSESHPQNLSILGKKYISLCIEPGTQNIFSINVDKLRTLYLGINLTFPTDSGRFCIPCSEEISDDSQLFDKHLYDQKHLQILKRLEDKHNCTKNCVKDQITDLDLAKSYMQGILVNNSDYLIKCFACNVKVENYDSEYHMNLESHIKNIRPWKKSAEEIFEEKKVFICDAWYYAEKFLCDLCSLKFYSDITFADHLIKEKHLSEVRRAESMKVNVEYNICGYCLTFWFGKANGYLTHCEGDFHKYLRHIGSHAILKLSSEVQTILKDYDKIIRELLELHENSDKSIETELLQSIQELVQDYYPYAKAYMYGSRMSLTNSSESDLDVYIDCGNSYNSVMSVENSRKLLKHIEKRLEQFQDTWAIQDILLQTTVPIIKLRHLKTNLNCDISSINGLVVEKSKLIRCYIEAYLPCQKLILFLKKWMHLCRLSGPQGINSFATSCLVIYYLQTEGILPNVHRLIQLKNNSNIIAGWETGFFKQISLQMSSGTSQPLLNMKDDTSPEILNHPIRDLLIGFFSYYSNFNYITNVICPFLGTIVKKEQFTSGDALPKEMENYKNLYKNGEAMFRFDSPMCVQDPLDLSKNITKAITKLQLRTFKQYCNESFFLLNGKSTKYSQD